MSDFTVVRPHIYVAGAIIYAANHNSNETTIYNAHNAAFSSSTGHGHTGATGDGPKLNSTGLDLTAAYSWSGVHTHSAAVTLTATTKLNLSADNDVYIYESVSGTATIAAGSADRVNITSTFLSTVSGVGLNVDSGTLYVDASSNQVLIGATSATVINGADAKLQVTSAGLAKAAFISSDSSSTAQSIYLYKNSSSPAASDGLCDLMFCGNDSGGNATQYATITGFIETTTDGSEDGGLRFSVVVNGAQTTRTTINSSGTTIAGDLIVDTSTLFVDSGSNQVFIGSATTASLGSSKFEVSSSTNGIALFQTTESTGTGMQVYYYKDSASPADGDQLVVFNYYGNASDSSTQLYARMLVVADDVTAGTEDSTFSFEVCSGASLISVLDINGGGIDVTGDVTLSGTLDVGAGVLSVSTINTASTNYHFYSVYSNSGAGDTHGFYSEVTNSSSGDAISGHFKARTTGAGASFGVKIDSEDRGLRFITSPTHFFDFGDTLDTGASAGAYYAKLPCRTPAGATKYIRLYDS